MQQMLGLLPSSGWLSTLLTPNLRCCKEPASCLHSAARVPEMPSLYRLNSFQAEQVPAHAGCKSSPASGACICERRKGLRVSQPFSFFAINSAINFAIKNRQKPTFYDIGKRNPLRETSLKDKEKSAFSCGFSSWWERMDSNHRRQKPTDLQS